MHSERFNSGFYLYIRRNCKLAVTLLAFYSKIKAYVIRYPNFGAKIKFFEASFHTLALRKLSDINGNQRSIPTLQDSTVKMEYSFADILTGRY